MCIAFASAAGDLRVGTRRARLLAALVRDDPDLEGRRNSDVDHERHADRPDRDDGQAHRTRRTCGAQLPDHQGRKVTSAAAQGSTATVLPPLRLEDSNSLRARAFRREKGGERRRHPTRRALVARSKPGGDRLPSRPEAVVERGSSGLLTATPDGRANYVRTLGRRRECLGGLRTNHLSSAGRAAGRPLLGRLIRGPATQGPVLSISYGWNRDGNCSMIPLLSMSAISRIWACTLS
jgi:hypothetical protein